MRRPDIAYPLAGQESGQADGGHRELDAGGADTLHRQRAVETMTHGDHTSLSLADVALYLDGVCTSDATRAHSCLVREQVSALDEATFARQAPVIYSVGSEPLPTSCRDLLGWLADHYDEHTAQVRDLLARWRAEGNG